MKIKHVLSHLETIAPPRYQESYDNAGLIVGDREAEVTGVLTCLDSTEAVVEEAIAKNCNLIIAHHPIVFRGLKSLTGRTYVERVVLKAIKNDIAIYAIHTNLDNVYHQGVNGKIAEKLGLRQIRILSPKQELKKLVVFVPISQSDALRKVLFEAGAGAVNGWQQLSHASVGMGTLRGRGEAEVKLEVLFASAQQGSVLQALQHYSPERELPYDILTVENVHAGIGSGMIGELPEPISELDFLHHLKTTMQTNCIRHTSLLDRPVQRIAVCGGAGGFLLQKAIAQKADVFVTADYKYHEFFDADGKLLIADIGHFESEQFTIELLQEIVSEKFTTFAVYSTEVNTNPVNYY